MKIPVLIVGGGLSGLTAAHQLHQAGVGFRLIEARERLGGRILTCDAEPAASADGFDLGPSWFWPDIQPAIGELVRELGLDAFAQHEEGDMLFERVHGEAPQRLHGMRQVPASMRISGGTGALVAALADRLPVHAIQLGSRVVRVTQIGQEVEVGLLDSNGTAASLRASHVLLALPPRLLAATVTFSPPIDAATAQSWRDTPTWMAPHAKFLAIYDRPFWREAGLSGTVQSTVGPLVETHDATSASGRAALFGFVGVPAAERARYGEAAVVAASVRQLTRLFGPEAATPQITFYKDWASDPLTATREDAQAGEHPESGPLVQVADGWRGYIWLAGSEAARQDAGYLAGAVHAARYATSMILSEMESAP